MQRAALVLVIALAILLMGCDDLVPSTVTPNVTKVPTPDPALDQSFAQQVRDGRVPTYVETEKLVANYLAREPDPHDFKDLDSFNAAYGPWQEQDAHYNDLLAGAEVKGWQGWVAAVSETDEPPGYELSVYMDDPYKGVPQRNHKYALDPLEADVVISGLDQTRAAGFSTGMKVGIQATIKSVDFLSGKVDMKAVQIDSLASESDSYEVGPQSDASLDGFQAAIEHTPCFGSCSVYKVTVLGDGTLTYEGERFVEVTGTAKSTLPEGQVRRLAHEFEQADFFNLADNYPMSVSDNPGVVLSLTVKGKSKQVTHDRSSRSAPRKLFLLEQKFDQIVNSSQWVTHR
jgi:hypothetical protein